MEQHEHVLSQEKVSRSINTGGVGVVSCSDEQRHTVLAITGRH